MKFAYLFAAMLAGVALPASPIAGLWLAAHVGSMFVFPIAPALCVATILFFAWKAENC